jgi:hypothetical protein
MNTICFATLLTTSTTFITFPDVHGFQTVAKLGRCQNGAPFPLSRHQALSDKYMDNDLVAVKIPDSDSTRLCAVKQWGIVDPLCQHEDDVETDLFVDPRKQLKFYEELTDEAVTGIYGEGFYGQRPVPSLGGGPGYGAPADEIWSVDEEILE